MRASNTTMLRSAAIAGLLVLAAGGHAQAQSRDAGARDAGTDDAAPDAPSEDEPDEDDLTGEDGVYYPDEGAEDQVDDDVGESSAVQAAGGGIGCALGGGRGAAGALALVGVLAALRRRPRA